MITSGGKLRLGNGVPNTLATRALVAAPVAVLAVSVGAPCSVQVRAVVFPNRR
jgi:hypothetical protein